MQSLKINLPDDLRAALDGVSAKSGKSLSQEIRRLLGIGMEYEGLRYDVHAIIDAAIWLTEALSRDDAPWYESRTACEAIGVALQRLLMANAPAAEAPDALANEDAGTLGRAMAGLYFRDIRKRGKS